MYNEKLFGYKMLITDIIFMSLENMTPDESVTKGHEFYEFPLHEMP